MEARIDRRLLLVLGLALLIRLPFLNQAVEGDDHIYLSEAAHAQVEPLSPGHTTYVFLGNEVDLRGHPHPPLNAWMLAALLAVFGQVREVPFHLAYAGFSLVAAWAMWSLAQRFSPHPLWATLTFLAVPVFVVNGNSFETDLPLLAFWTAGVALLAAGRAAPAAVAMALAALTAPQAVFLAPILGVYVWLFRRRDRRAWLAIFAPPAAFAAWQLFERAATGALPAAVLAGYLPTFETLANKLLNAAALTVHGWWLVFPALVPPAAVLAWRKRREPETLFLLAWIGIFFACAVAVFFAGSARYLLPVAAPVALLASRLPRRWLAVGFAAQLALGLGLATVNYAHWAGYRDFARDLRIPAAGHRVWVNGEWGLRHYLEIDGALPLTRTQAVRPGDIVVTSELGRSVDVNAPLAPLAQAEIRPRLPLRLIGLESHSGYSTASRGLWPFGISSGPIDRVRADLVTERHPTLTWLPMDAPEAAEQIAGGVYGLEGGSFRWMGRRAVLVLKSPPEAVPIEVRFRIPANAPARRVAVIADGREIAAQTYPEPGECTLRTSPFRPADAAATIEITVDRVFSVAGDARELGVVLTAAGFAAAQ